MRTLLAIPLMLAPALAHAQACPGFSASGWTSITDSGRFYGERAVAIVRAAMARDRNGLEALVARDAKASLWYGDSGWAPRDFGNDPRHPDRTRPDFPGPDAMIALADLLKPRGFRIVLDQPGPISMQNPAHCVYSVEVLFPMAESGQAARLEFTFQYGKLEAVTGHQVALVEGQLP